MKLANYVLRSLYFLIEFEEVVYPLKSIRVNIIVRNKILYKDEKATRVQFRIKYHGKIFWDIIMSFYVWFQYFILEIKIETKKRLIYVIFLLYLNLADKKTWYIEYFVET